MAISAAFTVDGNANPARHTTTYGATVNLALVSNAGIKSAQFTIVSSSKQGTAIPALTEGGSPPGSTASFAMLSDPGDGLGRAFRVRCVVTSQYETDTTYGIVGVENDGGILPICFDEERDRSTTGYIDELNESLSPTTVADGSVTPAKLDANAGAYATYAATRAALTAGSHASGDTVRTAARAAVGDGGEGEWRIVPIGSYVDNGGVILTGGSFAALRKDLVRVSIRSFGAVGGDSVADSAAYNSMCEWVNGLATAAGGTTSAPGDVGVEVFFPRTDDPYTFDFSSYALDDVKIRNARGVRFVGNGTGIKVADGSSVGQTPSTDDDAFSFIFENCADVVVDGFRMDGNLANLNIGGVDGRGLGIGFYKVHDSEIRNCYITDYGTDGVFMWSRVANEDNRCENVTLTNVHVRRSRRNGMSVGSGHGITCVGCSFNESGTGPASTAPRAGVDLEPSFAVDTVNGVTFVGCKFLDNTSAGFIIDSNIERVNNVVLENCDIEWLWCRSPTVSIVGGKITKLISYFYGLIRSAEIEVGDGAEAFGLSIIGAGKTLIDNCPVTINCHSAMTAPIHLEDGGGKTLRDCTITFVDTDNLPSTVAGLLRDGETKIVDCTFTDSGTTKAVYLSVDDALIKNSRALSSVAFGGVSGGKFRADEGGFLDDPSTSNTFTPTAQKQALSGARTITAYATPALQKMRVKADGVTVTFTDNANFTPLTPGDLVLTTGQTAVLYFPTAGTATQLNDWEF